MAHVWGLWKQNVSINQIVSATEVLCWAAKWHGDEKTIFDSQPQSGRAGMVQHMWELLDEADVVVHYNGQRFDIPHLNREFLEHGLTPPAPYKQIDLMKVVKASFRFPSNKLDYVVQKLGLGSKVKHAGFQLWVDCLAGDPKAWADMETYNVQDTVLLEDLYTKLRPWVKNHPNVAMYTDKKELMCGRCGSTSFVKRGSYYTNVCEYQRYRCKDCGGWFKDRKRVPNKGEVTVNIAG